MHVFTFNFSLLAIFSRFQPLLAFWRIILPFDVFIGLFWPFLAFLGAWRVRARILYAYMRLLNFLSKVGRSTYILSLNISSVNKVLLVF